ncbi:MAG: hypothetical protein LBC18_01325 [Opitutaceae bacterium]|nr:hypothetical protein [Opitutaceae bacterium]
MPPLDLPGVVVRPHLLLLPDSLLLPEPWQLLDPQAHLAFRGVKLAAAHSPLLPQSQQLMK